MRKIITLLSLLFVLLPASAQSLGFLLLSGDAATAGMAGAGVAMEGTAYAPDINMASAALSQGKMDAAAGYTRWSPSYGKNTILSASGYFKVSKKIAIGADWKHFGISSYDITSSEGRVTGSYSPKEFALGLGFSYEIVNGLAAGVHLKFASSSMAEKASGSAFGADISLQYRNGGLCAGLAADNVGTKVKYGENAYSMPLRIRAGASYTIVGVTAAAEAQLVGSAFMAALGAQYNWNNTVFVRAGYHLGPETAPIPSYLSLGVGFKIAGIHADVCYMTASQTLGNTLGVSLGYAF